MAAVDDELVRDRPMQRLVMGEVGSGKTAVAVYAMLRAVESGAQAALMAPTEMLAEQHFATLQALMPASGAGRAVHRLDPGGPARRPARQARQRRADLLVGSHALIQEAVEFDRLAVAVVDEQHRFGVNQRRALDRSAGRRRPARAAHDRHADPAHARLTAYGDLDVTVLKELPAGRWPIVTHAAPPRPSARAPTSASARSCAQAARRSSSARSSRSPRRAGARRHGRVRAAEGRRAEEFEVALLHGQMRPREKQEAMAAFAAGGADVLVATTVIEVGIDVPNATVMLVEDSERYGISQLHQLRGRIGRGEHESLCLLFGPKESPRLRALAKHRDGFELAEIDLELRGEGEMLGTRQSGLQAFRFARLPEDVELLERARMRARSSSTPTRSSSSTSTR